MILATDGVIQGASALAALWNGAFGSWYAFLSATLVRATPLLLLGLAVALAFRAGVLNIGAEGQFLAGAVGATLVALHSAGLPGFVVFASMLAAGAVGGAPAGSGRPASVVSLRVSNTTAGPVGSGSTQLAMSCAAVRACPYR